MAFAVNRHNEAQAISSVITAALLHGSATPCSSGLMLPAIPEGDYLTLLESVTAPFGAADGLGLGAR
ncbi:hypothetical protein J2W42_006783 [Rhizobium tibeticum]|uniref:Uncharacterized protein n=1 Tax=Rhizobium tibeticum TaxID=501024 RepID=A0A1H8WJ27_9HYPH|nr:hypothetical protein [Rhizobium tibeticum]SEI20731.1 hypothetical protein RTCCBAU85039_6460 [Rhizobium tibeticum]SEP27694.1 hypothetical protein SAMN05216228_106618 [Rhizobium tibeticum]